MGHSRASGMGLGMERGRLPNPPLTQDESLSRHVGCRRLLGAVHQGPSWVLSVSSSCLHPEEKGHGR